MLVPFSVFLLLLSPLSTPTFHCAPTSRQQAQADRMYIGGNAAGEHGDEATFDGDEATFDLPAKGT